MKVFSDLARVSPLETWLRDAELADSGAAQKPHSAESSAAALPGAATPIPDTAERLLDLDVWSDAPPTARFLVTTADPPQASAKESIASAQQWADHIFAPLR
jgi:hypothetical protein